MLEIIVILLVAYIFVPLVDLTLNERAQNPVKIVVYAVVLVLVLYWLIVGKMP